MDEQGDRTVVYITETDLALSQHVDRIKRDGYLACCDFHGNLIFRWSEKYQAFYCPAQNGLCPAHVKDFRWSLDVEIGWINFMLSRPFKVNDPGAREIMEQRDGK